jgi:hypothetical protein
MNNIPHNKVQSKSVQSELSKREYLIYVINSTKLRHSGVFLFHYNRL